MKGEKDFKSIFKPTPVNPPFFPGPWPLFEAMPWPATFRQVAKLKLSGFRVYKRDCKGKWPPLWGEYIGATNGGGHGVGRMLREQSWLLRFLGGNRPGLRIDGSFQVSCNRRIAVFQGTSKWPNSG